MIKQAVQERFEQEIGNIVEDLKSYKPQKIILFGSFNTSDINAHSDIDLCIILNNSNKRFLDRINDVLQLIHSSFAVEPLVYTKEEFERLQNQGNPLIENIATNGKILYEQKS